MGLTEQKKKEWEGTLKDSGLLSLTDKIQDTTKGDLWDFGSQISGTFFFTAERLVFVGGLGGSTSFSAPYNKMTQLKLCNVGGLIPIMPTGILVTYTDENGKSVKKKCSVLKRKDWLAFLRDKTGIAES